MSHSTDESASRETASRRNFVAKVASAAIGTVLGLVPLVTGLIVFLDPLRRQKSGLGFIRVASLDALPPGVPRRYSVVADRTDAWSQYRREPIGAVFLRRLPDKNGEPQVQALQVMCPHANCPVEFDLDGMRYHCPCHRSAFEIDGNVIQPSPSARGLDDLEVNIEGDDVLVRYEEFRQGSAEQTPIA
jgi:menaquinol-cytochrome c reductase iron-sulfur subunit